MNIILSVFTAVLTGCSAVFTAAKYFQMLQQNSYVNSRYNEWLKNDSLPFGRATAGILLALLLFLNRFITLYPAAVFAAFVLVISVFSARKLQKSSIKPLVFTARVKRMYFTYIILFVIPAVLSGLSILQYTAPFVSLILFVLCDYIVMLVNLINRPVEKAVSNRYINDAKRILGESPDMLVIGVTGSYGKTGTKFILGRLLSEKFNTVVTPESYNTPMGVVRTVREKIVPGTQIFVAEMGAKNVGDIKEICDIVHPKTGIITSVGPQHLNTFGTIENIVKTKFELADEVAANGGKIFLNGDNEYIVNNSGKYSNRLLYGTDKVLACHAENMTYSAQGSSFDIVSGNVRIPVTTRLLGSYNVLNIIAAASVALELEVSPEDIRFAVGTLKAVPHRLELKSFINGAVLIDDAYNANPDGCLEAVRVLSHFDGMKKIIVTPGLVELGEKEYDYNFRLGKEAGNYCDEIYLVGRERSKPMLDALDTIGFDRAKVHVVSAFKEALDALRKTADKNTAVLFENDLPDNYLK